MTTNSPAALIGMNAKLCGTPLKLCLNFPFGSDRASVVKAKFYILFILIHAEPRLPSDKTALSKNKQNE